MDDPFVIGAKFDHEFPRSPPGESGAITTFDGAQVPGPEGHNGIDFIVPDGTPVRAVADGTISRILRDERGFCPPLGRVVNGGRRVDLTFAAEGQTYIAVYAHLSQIDVTEGQVVRRGEVLGLTGSSGCATGAHLHLALYRRTGQTLRSIDPFGWIGVGRDPWASHPDGAASPRWWIR